MASCTYIIVAEIPSPNHIQVEADLVALAGKYPGTRWQWGPREVNITPAVATVAAAHLTAQNEKKQT